MKIDWQEIIGHQQNIECLHTLLAEQRMPHALLFTGPQGVGKRRVGEVLAAALLCTDSGPEPGKPCGHCASCQALLTDTHPDFYTVVPESRGKSARIIRIEQVRELQTEIARIPMLSPRRVVLMDDVETMNDAAANSLLKTLEEPAGQVVFILITSARSSLLDTIVSRCMPLSFGTLPLPELAAALGRQGVPAPQAAELAALADGSLGRALQLYQDGGMELRDDAVSFLQGLGGMDMEGVWTRSRKMGELPREKLSEWFMYLNMLLRDMLVLYSGSHQQLLYHQDITGQLAAMLTDFSEQRIFLILELIRTVQQRLGANVNLRLLMESFLIRIRELQ